MKNFTGFAILYVLAFGLNHGFCYMVPIHHGWLWFPERPGLISGIIIGGFGVSGIIFDNMFTHMINPDNLPIDEDGFYPDSVNERFSKSYLTLIFCWLGLSAIGFGFIFRGPPKKSKV